MEFKKHIKPIVILGLIPICFVISAQISRGDRWPDFLGGVLNLEYQASRVFAFWLNTALIYISSLWPTFLIMRWKITRSLMIVTALASLFFLWIIFSLFVLGPSKQPEIFELF